MLQLPILVNDRDVVRFSKWDGYKIGKILAATDQRKLNVIS